jgi:uncharacterized protein
MRDLLEFLSAPARQAAVLDEREHRPWPLPDGPWVMAQTWEHLLFAHWRVEAAAVRRVVPANLAVDQHAGSAWLGITPFVISGLRLRGTWPLARLSTFPELNVRTYVTAEHKPGIWFFSLDTSSALAVEAARRLYRLPYFHARMSFERRAGRIEFSSTRRGGARPFVFAGSYEPAGEASEPHPGSLEHFLTERYCLYAHHGGRLHRAEIHHPRWRIRPARALIDLNTMPPDALELPGEPPLCHLAERQDVVIWPREHVAPNHKPRSEEGSSR